MDLFDIGEAVICSITVKDENGALQDPATSMNIEIGRIKPTESKVSSTGMTKDSTGTYHYDADTSGWNYGIYEVIYTAVDGARITIQKDTFSLK